MMTICVTGICKGEISIKRTHNSVRICIRFYANSRPEDDRRMVEICFHIICQKNMNINDVVLTV